MKQEMLKMDAFHTCEVPQSAEYLIIKKWAEERENWCAHIVYAHSIEVSL